MVSIPHSVYSLRSVREVGMVAEVGLEPTTPSLWGW